MTDHAGMPKLRCDDEHILHERPGCSAGEIETLKADWVIS